MQRRVGCVERRSSWWRLAALLFAVSLIASAGEAAARQAAGAPKAAPRIVKDQSKSRAQAAAQASAQAQEQAKAKAKAAADVAEFGKPGDLVAFKAAFPAGAIVVVNEERRLYYVLGNGSAIRYPVAVGRDDELWTGKSFVQAKVRNPEWVPVDDPERRVPAGPDNPLGERALYLGWTLYRIHGTNAPRSIGNAASAGCIRMHNFHVKDLFERVHIGAPVFVLDTLSRGEAALRRVVIR